MKIEYGSGEYCDRLVEWGVEDFPRLSRSAQDFILSCGEQLRYKDKLSDKQIKVLEKILRIDK
jgi:hypothetical protein